MGIVRGYSDLLRTLNSEPRLKSGIVVDTNVLISATYDADLANSEAFELFDFLAELEVPKFCNVNVRYEFLEIHRRLIFTEALLHFDADKVESPMKLELLKKLNSLKARSGKAEKNDSPFRMSENEIKQFKILLHGSQWKGRNAWSAVCRDLVGTKISNVWTIMQDELGLNFLSLRDDDVIAYMDAPPNWDQVTQLMEEYGLSSSDAMIMNIFLCSKFLGLISSDMDIALSFKMMPDTGDKILFVPDRLLKNLA